MKGNRLYSDVYHGTFKTLAETELKSTLIKFKEIYIGYIAGIKVNVLERQVGMEEEDVKSLVENFEEEIRRIKQYKRKCVKDNVLKDEDILKRLEENERIFTIRYLDGELPKSICEDLGIIYRGRIIRKFLKSLYEKGYGVKDIQLHFRIFRDIERGLEVREIVQRHQEKITNEREMNKT